MKTLFYTCSGLVIAGILGAIVYASNVSQQPMQSVTLRHQTSGEVAFAEFVMPDNTVQEVKISQKDKLKFDQTNYDSIKPDPTATFIYAAGGVKALDTVDGYPHAGDAYEQDDLDTGGKVLVVATSDAMDWSYSFAKATDPGTGQTSQLQGKAYESQGSRLYFKQYDVQNLPQFSVSNNTATVTNGADTIVKDIKIQITLIEKTIPNHHSVTFDTKSTGNGLGASTVTIAHVITSNTNRYMAGSASFGLASSQILTSVKWNTTETMISETATNTPSNLRRAEYSDLVNPTSGSFNVVFTWDKTTNSVEGVQSAYGVDQVNPRQTIATPTVGTGVSPAITVASSVNNMVFSLFTSVGGGATTDTVDPTWISDWSSTANSATTGAGAHIAGATSVTRTDVLNTSVGWACVAVSIQAPQTVSSTVYTNNNATTYTNNNSTIYIR